MRLILLMLFTITSSVIAEKPAVEIKDARIDSKLYTASTAFIDRTSGVSPENWTVIILDLDVKIPENYKLNHFENGKWLDSLQVEWEFLYLPRKFDNHISNYVKFKREVTYRHVPLGENKVALFIEPAVMERYFDDINHFKNNLLTKVTFKHDGTSLGSYFLEGDSIDKEAKYSKAFNSSESFHLDHILKIRLETPFRNYQTAKFLTVAQ